MELRDLRIGKGVNKDLINALGGQERIWMAIRLAIHAVGNRFSFKFPATVEHISLLKGQPDGGGDAMQISGRILPPTAITFYDKTGARYLTQCWTRKDFSVRLRTNKIS